jgi:hypothetical protein
MNYIALSRKAKDLAGQRFGRLVAMGPVGQRKTTEVLWLCQCDCGNQATARASLLANGTTRSCGCLAREGVSGRNRKHGFYGTHIYKVWQGMKGRCSDFDSDHYASYGGRGIRVCAEWVASFQSFYSHVSGLEHFGDDGYTLDRIDVDGHYEPGNVRWATANEQGRNKRSNRLLTYQGRTQPMAAWAEELGIDNGTLFYRLSHGWEVERALATPVRGIG